MSVTQTEIRDSFINDTYASCIVVEVQLISFHSIRSFHSFGTKCSTTEVRWAIYHFTSSSRCGATYCPVCSMNYVLSGKTQTTDPIYGGDEEFTFGGKGTGSIELGNRNV